MNSDTSNVQLFVGAEGIKAVYERSLQATAVDFICLSTEYSKILGDWYDAEFAPKLFTSLIQTRELLPDTQENRSYAGKKDVQKNQVWFVSGKTSESDVILTAEWAALVSFNEKQPMAILIEEEEIVAALREQFEQLWKLAKK